MKRTALSLMTVLFLLLTLPTMASDISRRNVRSNGRGADPRSKTKHWKEILIEQGWQLLEKPTDKQFDINGVKLLWHPGGKNNLPSEKNMKVGKTYYPSTAFHLKLEFPEQLRGMDLGTSLVNASKEIKNPWEYKFNGYGLSFGWTHTNIDEERAGVLIKVGDTFFSVKPMGVVQNEFQFLLKSWQTPTGISTTPEPISSEDVIDLKEWQVSAVPISTEFRIGSVTFSWKPKEKKYEGLERYFDLVFSAEKDKKLLLGIPNLGIKYLSQYTYGDDRPSKWNWHVSKYDKYSKEKEFRPLPLKIDEEFILIMPIASKVDTNGFEWIQYQWKHWPASTSPEVGKLLAKLEPPLQ